VPEKRRAVVLLHVEGFKDVRITGTLTKHPNGQLSMDFTGNSPDTEWTRWHGALLDAFAVAALDTNKKAKEVLRGRET
jgi:hypothetical protein